MSVELEFKSTLKVVIQRKKMKGIVSACVSTFIIFGLCKGIEARKPKMTPAVSEMLIQEGDELKIQCQGEGILKFSTQTNTACSNSSEFSNSTDGNSGTYTFICPESKREDTGWYACAENGTSIQNDEQNIDHESNDIAWIYVYVNSSEPLVIDSAFDLLTAVAGRRLVVPCRPTSPNVTVTLQMNWGATNLPENTTYDPKIGFIIPEIGLELSGHIFECSVDGPEVKTASFTLHVAGTSLENPKINLDGIRHVVWGRDMTVDCEITVPSHTLFTMSWKVPESVPKERWSYSNVSKSVSDGSTDNNTWVTKLTVKNVEKSDCGEYTCIAEHLSIHSEARELIRIWDPSYTYLNATPKGPTDVIVREHENAFWEITIDAYPENVTLAWYKPNGREIAIKEPDTNSKYSHARLGLNHFLKIYQANVEDSGNYTLKLFTGIHQKIITFGLTVHAAPSVFMDKALPFYLPGNSATFTCQTLGLPLPNITWIVKEYSNFTSKENPELKYPLNATNKMGEKGPYHLVSTLNVVVNQTGYVTCRSCNKINCVESTEHLLISDVSGHFGIIDPGIVTEGDDISVTCGGSVYNFTESPTWKLMDNWKNQELKTSRIRLTRRTTNFTSQSILEIRNVQKSDAGRYTCEAVNADGLPEREEYELIVHGALAPRFNVSNMGDSEISVDLKNERERSMVWFCFAEGMPIPQVTWYKNGQLLVENNQYKFSKNNRQLMIAYFLDGDSGRYLCRAKNRVGTSEKYMDIVIIENSHRQPLLIYIISGFVIIFIVVITYMGIKLYREKVMRKELLDAVSVKYQEGAVRYWNADSDTDLVLYNI